jgi:two-component system nitrogen regulation response regulator GlnG
MSFFFKRAARELGVESKILLPETETILASLDWPGNVRQLENTCRWLTVMAPGREIHRRDLPPELLDETISAPPDTGSWQQALQYWADQVLARGETGILNTAVPEFERIMIEAALKKTHGRRREASELLGWGRNTLTRKIKELGLGDDDGDDD